ncbi:Organic hydroperoxide resistance transcriptional regulator [Sesbania bispinosa]|nr:Organic hydroperoxide resistance transcriptional regulator [Sesbania bispinosa]
MQTPLEKRNAQTCSSFNCSSNGEGSLEENFNLKRSTNLRKLQADEQEHAFTKSEFTDEQFLFSCDLRRIKRRGTLQSSCTTKRIKGNMNQILITLLSHYRNLQRKAEKMKRKTQAEKMKTKRQALSSRLSFSALAEHIAEKIEKGKDLNGKLIKRE